MSLALPFTGTLSTQGDVFTIIQPDAGGTAIYAVSGGTDPYGDTPMAVSGFVDTDGAAIVGTSGQGFAPVPAGVFGSSPINPGVFGVSLNYHGVVGETQSDAQAGVTGRNLSNGANGGCGIYGVGGRYGGKFEGEVLIMGNNNTPAKLSVWGDAEITGDVAVKGDVILVNEFTGDCAEDFDVEDKDAAQPGTVLVIGPEGKLTSCRDAYDTRIAGVVSGAGELRPALV